MENPFKWRHYEPEIILLCTRRYLRCALSFPVLLVISWFSAVVLVGCSPDIQTEPVLMDSTSQAIERVTVLPTPLPVLETPVTEVVESLIDAAPQSVCQTEPVGASVRYDVTATLDWPAYKVHVLQRVILRNDTGQALQDVVFNVFSNREPDHFALEQVTAGENGEVAKYVLDSMRLAVSLPDTLLVGCESELTLEYELALPSIRNGYQHGHLGYLGYSNRQVNLGMWLPLIAYFDPAQGWVTPDFHPIGEQAVLRTADFSVELTVVGASDDIRVAGPGEVTHTGDTTWQFVLRGGREITLSVSESFHTISTETASGIKVDLYYFPDPLVDSLDTPRHVLHTASDALSLYEELFGPCPYSRLVVVQGDFPDGMEFSGLVFVSDTWFRSWQGIPNDWLTIITAHEIAHQWWYVRVGSDQGNEPYIDEALATYSELLFFEQVYPDFTDWWWQFRVGYYMPTGYVDSPVYAFSSVRSYIDAVYLRGVQMLDMLRHDLGDDVFFEWLRVYAERMQGRVASSEDFWRTMPEGAYWMTRDTRTSFLKRADVFPRSAELP